MSTEVDEKQQNISQAPAKRIMPLWFKIVAGIAFIALVAVTAGILFTETVVDIIEDQLKSLRTKDYEQAYHNYTSTAFQDATSYEQFLKFLQVYPIFINNTSSHFNKRSMSITNDMMIVRGNLTSPEHLKYPVEYRLIKEEGKWKILSIQLLSSKGIRSAPESAQPIDLLEVAQAQLADIKNGRVNEAYQTYSSKEFKEATSEEEFVKFVKRYPILVNYTSNDFQEPKVYGEGINSVSAVLSNQEMDAFVKYYFVYEGNGWKILSMRILSPSEETPEKESKAEEK